MTQIPHTNPLSPFLLVGAIAHFSPAHLIAIGVVLAGNLLLQAGFLGIALLVIGGMSMERACRFADWTDEQWDDFQSKKV